MSNKKENKKTFAFQVEQDGKTITYTFVRDSFINPQEGKIKVKDMFEGEDLKDEYAPVVQRLVKIRSGVIKATVEESASAPSEDDEALKELQEKYKELSGKAPGNMKAETLQARIAELENGKED